MSDGKLSSGASADRARRIIARRRAWRWPLYIALASLLLVATGGGILFVAYQGAEARAVQVIKDLGGRVRWQDDRPRRGRVVSAFLGVAELGDADLARLTPFWWTFPELRDLDLSHSAITDASLARLRGSTLRNLVLDHTGITSDGLKHLAGNTELRSLSLNGTQIGDEGLKHLAGLPRLGNLYLGGAPISDQGLQILEGFAALRYLQLGGNREVTEEGLKQLQRARPELKISK
jgi:hypothetical protein